MRVIYWLAIFIVLLIIEIATMGLTTIWFAGGALVAFCAGFVGFGLGVQITNAESLIGQHALVTEDIDTIKAKGQVEICGQIWSAKTDEPDGKIPKNTVVVVNGIQGVKLIVHAREE